MRQLTIAFALVCILVSVVYASLTEPKLFWSESQVSKLQKSKLDGTQVEDILATSTPLGMDIDPTACKIYWAGIDMRRADFDGSNVEILAPLVTSSFAIDLDLVNGKIYYARSMSPDGHIRRMDLDGSNDELVIDSLNTPYGLAVDVGGGKVYWTEAAGDILRRANLDGTVVQTLATTTNPAQITLDIATGHVYWGERVFTPGGGQIRRIDLNGVNGVVLVTGLDNPNGIALAGSHVYWTDYTDTGPQKIQRANLDGSNIVDLNTNVAVFQLQVATLAAVPTLTNIGAVVLVITMLLVGLYYLSRRRALI